jgi:hypothetical protein
MNVAAVNPANIPTAATFLLVYTHLGYLLLGKNSKKKKSAPQSVATKTQKTIVRHCEATMSLLCSDAGVDEEEERSSMLSWRSWYFASE